MGGLGHHRSDQDTSNAKSLEQLAQHHIELLPLDWILVEFRKLPRSRLDDIAVQATEVAPQAVQCLVNIILRKGSAVVDKNLVALIPHLLISSIQIRWVHSWRYTIAVFVDHAQRPGGQVAKSVRQIRVQAIDESLEREIPVLAHLHVPQEVVTQGVVAELEERIGTHHIALGLAHLVVAHEPPSMGEDGLGQFQPHGHEEGGPVDSVEAEDVLAHDLKIGRPNAIRCSREVIQQRIEPHIDHMRLIAWDRNAPGDAGAADGEVLETPFYESLHLVEAEVRLDEIGVLFVPLQQRLLVLAEAEVVSLFFQFHELVGQSLGL